MSVTNSSASNNSTSSQEWSSLSSSLDSRLISTLLTEFGFSKMTPVQAATIPCFLSNKDVAVEAATGSGKTLAFVVPLLQMLLRREDPLKKHDVGAIIISPVRELATQIFQVFKPFVQKLDNKFHLALVTGGNENNDDIDVLRKDGVNIIVGTPGRVAHILATYPEFKVRELDVLVLDEADRLLSMGFESSLNAILAKLPKQRRTGLFSATQTSEVKQLIRAGLRNPVKVSIKVQSANNEIQKTPRQLDNFYTICESESKLNQLVHFLAQNKDKKIIVYFLTCACVNYFHSVLTLVTSMKSANILSLHGKIPQAKRTKIFKSFMDLKSGILLSTDLASRGLDIPDDPDAFIHRVGRTARIGKEGSALLFLAPSEDSYIEYLHIKKVPISERKLEPTPVDVLGEVRKEMTQNRDLFDKAQVAFVSYIRAYKEHVLSYIFRFSKIDYGKLATGFGLIQLPKMPELRNINVENFKPVDIDLSTIPYKNATKEQQRQQKMKNWKLKKEQRANEQQSDENQTTDAPTKKASKRKVEEETNNNSASDDEDDEELERDTQLMKKLKRGSISEAQFDEMLLGDKDTQRAPKVSTQNKHKSASPSSAQRKKNKKKNKKQIL